jgi:HAD superfamily hydrolase (TIGR01509 family)
MIAVGFDFDHTLAIDNKLERTVALEMLAELAQRFGVTYDEAAAQAAVEEMLHAYRSGQVPLETAVEGFFLRFVDEGEAIAGETTFFRDRCVLRAREFVRGLPGLRDTLAALDAMHVRYALLTNGWSPLQEEKARLIGFEAPVYVSERLGVRKPERGAFDVLAHLFDLPPASIWYVGDDPEVDCAGAKAAGMTAVWFDWEERTYPQGLIQPDYTIHALDELPSLLQGHASKVANPAE